MTGEIAYKKGTGFEINEIQFSIFQKLGYSLDDLELIFGGKVETLEEFKSFPPEMVILGVKKDIDCSFDKGGFKLKMSKGSEWFVDLQHFMELYDQVGHCIIPTDKMRRKIKRYRGEDLSKKILLYWMYGIGLGDILFSQPILRFLKMRYPSCYIIAGIPLNARPLFERQSIIEKLDIPFVDEIINVPFNAKFFYRADYHLAFDSIILKCKEAETENIYKLFNRWANTGIPDICLNPSLAPDPSRVAEFKKLFQGLTVFNPTRPVSDFILVQLNSNSIIRTPRPVWKLALLDKLCEAQKKPIVICDSPGKAKENDFLVQSCKYRNRVFNISEASRSVADLVAVASLASACISVDTGTLHIANAQGVPTFGIFGAFPGRIRCGTYPLARWIDSPASCAPCCSHGFEPCQFAREEFPVCYDAIEIDSLVEKIKTFVHAEKGEPCKI